MVFPVAILGRRMSRTDIFRSGAGSWEAFVDVGLALLRRLSRSSRCALLSWTELGHRVGAIHLRGGWLLLAKVKVGLETLRADWSAPLAESRSHGCRGRGRRLQTGNSSVPAVHAISWTRHLESLGDGGIALSFALPLPSGCRRWRGDVTARQSGSDRRAAHHDGCAIACAEGVRVSRRRVTWG